MTVNSAAGGGGIMFSCAGGVTWSLITAYILIIINGCGRNLKSRIC